MLDPQMKRGLLDVCVLSAICREESYGYKIIKDMPPQLKISESTLYPILRRLEASGCLTVHTIEHNGRLRKMYRITETGKEQIRASLSDWGDLVAIYEFIKEGLHDDQA